MKKQSKGDPSKKYNNLITVVSILIPVVVLVALVAFLGFLVTRHILL